MSWSLKLVGKEDCEENAANSSNNDGDNSKSSSRMSGPKEVATASSDIGFAVLLHEMDGTLPMLLPYK